MNRTTRAAWFIGLLAALALVAWASPSPELTTDRGVYEKTAEFGIVPDCWELHCFRVLVPWALGSIPGPSIVKWKLYAAAGNAVAGLAVFSLALAFGVSARGATLAMVLSAFGYGSMYTLFDPYTADPLMYWLGPYLTLSLIERRLTLVGIVSTVGVFGKEFAAVPLAMFAALEAWRRDIARALRTLAWTNVVFIVWLAWQLVLIIRFNYGYGDNPSTSLLDGGYLAFWWARETPRAALSAILNEFGALYLLAAAGLWFASTDLRRLVVIALPVAVVFIYVQQPDRALWNFHFLVVPLSALVLERVPPALAWTLVVLFALANLRTGAQLLWVPASRYALFGSMIVAVAMMIVAATRPRTRTKEPQMAAV